jgi:threonine/homoserine/homoserine lactone efflux protein
METLLKGSAIGFLIAVPVGPIGVLCIRRSLTEGWRVGLATGLGAATADAAYGAVAAFGLTALTTALVEGRVWLAIVGGLFLVYLGLRTFTSSPGEAAEVRRGGAGLLAAYASTFLLTVTNPATIISFAAVFAGWGVGTAGDWGAAGMLVAGVFVGSAAWWLILSGGVSALRSKVKPPMLRWVNRVSGAVLLLFGVGVLASLLVSS